MKFIKLTTVTGQPAYVNLAHVAAVVQGERNDKPTWHVLCEGVRVGVFEVADADAKELLEVVSGEIADAAALQTFDASATF
ncbi:MAG TPA: hypothetical protein VMV69_08840 [Pirellulales bacterium]|nr:hypothetical protein [Pirellulales bacterium]